MFDKIVFSKIKERLGGRVRLVVSGERRRAACHKELFLCPPCFCLINCN